MRAALALALAAASLCAQQLQVENARVETRQFSGSLAAQLKALGPGPYWAAWTQPVTPRQGGDMCGSYNGIVRLEGQTAIVILIRVENSVIERLRVTSPDCRLDGGNLPFYSITGVPAAENAAWLKLQLAASTDNKMRQQVLFVLSESSEPGAMNTLLDAAKNDKDPRVRKQALFWIAQRAASKQAADAIGNAIDNDPDTAVKEQAVFALTQLPHDQGTPLLIGVAKNNANLAVRKKAMFWLGQSNDPRALDFFTQVLKQ